MFGEIPEIFMFGEIQEIFMFGEIQEIFMFREIQKIFMFGKTRQILGLEKLGKSQARRNSQDFSLEENYKGLGLEKF